MKREEEEAFNLLIYIKNTICDSMSFKKTQLKAPLSKAKNEPS
jgi:hypothetical protein